MSAGRSLRLIGVDVATQPKNVGLALCTLSNRELQLEHVTAHSTWPNIDRQLADWLEPMAGPPTLLAIDAPLGWPATLAQTLHTHCAGAPIPPTANALFRRNTDNVVAKALGKRPLDVGADRIARTAHAALQLLSRLREVHALEIPLAWRPGSIATTCTIEVYPAGTLVSRALPSSGYKGTSAEATTIRRQIIDGIEAELKPRDELIDLMSSSDHLLDAALCCLAAGDFVDARVIEPEDPEIAKQEGWIWVAANR